MPKQIGIIKLKGKIGDLSLYKSKDGYMARQKGGIDKERIQKDPAFERTRENGREFGRAARNGKLVRAALKSVLSRAQDSRITARLHQVMMQVLQTDPVNGRGERSIVNGNMQLLHGFECNAEAPLASTLFVPYTLEVDRSTGIFEVKLESFSPVEAMNVPEGTTHFRLLSASAEVNINQNTYKSVKEDSDWLSWDGAILPEMSLQHQLSADSKLPVFTLLGIEFGQEVNGEIYLLQSGAYNALQIISVDTL